MNIHGIININSLPEGTPYIYGNDDHMIHMLMNMHEMRYDWWTVYKITTDELMSEMVAMTSQ